MIGKSMDSLSEVHGAALSASDIDAIKGFLHDYASKALIPHLEKQIAQLTEVVSKINRQLFSHTRDFPHVLLY